MSLVLFAEAWLNLGEVRRVGMFRLVRSALIFFIKDSESMEAAKALSDKFKAKLESPVSIMNIIRTILVSFIFLGLTRFHKGNPLPRRF